MLRLALRRAVLLSSLFAAQLWAEGAADVQIKPLPEPLTLEYALSLVDEGAPSVLAEQAAQAQIAAERDGAEAESALDVSVEGRARWVKPPSIASDQNVTDDHKLSLFVRKPLYDFGRTSSRVEAAQQEELSQKYRFQSFRDERRITIMQAYFDVLLADMEYARDNEAMAVSYITLDRLRNRQELGQTSDIAVLEQEADYQQTRYQTALSENRQRSTRSVLANLLNRPGMLPATLERPKLGYEERKLPDFDKLLEKAVQNNPRIKALEASVEAARQRVEAARSDKLPRLDGELEASSYSRELASSDRWRAGVTLQVPIYSGGRVKAAVAAQVAQQSKAQAALDQERYDLRQELLQQWLIIQRLKLQRDKANSEQDYRELYLDRSRADYELEFKADLGDAMVRLSEAQLAVAQTDYQLALAWEKLEALSGGKAQQAPGETMGAAGE